MFETVPEGADLIRVLDVTALGTQAKKRKLALYPKEIALYQLIRYRLQEQLNQAFGDQAPVLDDR